MTETMSHNGEKYLVWNKLPRRPSYEEPFIVGHRTSRFCGSMMARKLTVPVNASITLHYFFDGGIDDVVGIAARVEENDFEFWKFAPPLTFRGNERLAIHPVKHQLTAKAQTNEMEIRWRLLLRAYGVPDDLGQQILKVDGTSSRIVLFVMWAIARQYRELLSTTRQVLMILT